jgi:hypothetical protein
LVTKKERERETFLSPQKIKKDFLKKKKKKKRKKNVIFDFVYLNYLFLKIGFLFEREEKLSFFFSV